MAKKKAAKNAELSGAEKAAIGVGLTATAVAAAGAYFLYGSPNAAKNRKKVKSWSLKAKAEVLEALEKAEAITEQEYNELVELAVDTFGKVQSATKGDVADFKKEMKEHWQKIEKSTVGKKVKKVASAAVSSAAKKT
ncbi:MAG: hypothetical protein AAFO91_09535, partial [Bacteroidota bacterium]